MTKEEKQAALDAVHDVRIMLPVIAQAVVCLEKRLQAVEAAINATKPEKRTSGETS